jgi:hypothetical protein
MPGPTSVLIFGVSDLLADMLSVALSSHADIVVRRRATAPSAGDPAPDVVVVPADDAAKDGPVRAVLHDWPASLVVAIAPGGRGLYLYELRPVRTRLENVSLGEFITTIRSARSRPPGPVVDAPGRP